MWALSKQSFFSFIYSFLGISICALFVLVTGLFTWYLDGNLLDQGFAEMGVFFDLMPWFFILFSPAFAMKLWAEEIEQGTLVLLRMPGLSAWDLIFAKFFGMLALVLLCLFPTLLYVWSLHSLALTGTSLDLALVLGQYLSVLLLASNFLLLDALLAIAVPKQALAYVLGLMGNVFLWEFPNLFHWEYLQWTTHFADLSRGLLRLEDLSFFLGIDLLLLAGIRLLLAKRYFL